MNPLTRYEPLVGRLDGLFDEFFRPALVWENNAEPHDPRRRAGDRPRPTPSTPSCPA